MRPVGGTREMPIDVRIVAATNQLPAEAIAAGRLREDLYYRLAVLTIEVPPLGNRPEDVAALAGYFLERTRERFGAGPSRITPEAMAVLQAYRWPGNVRELENLFDRLFALGTDREAIEASDLPAEIRNAATAGGSGPSRPGSPFVASGTPQTLKEGEAFLIRQALEKAEGNKTRAAKALGISRPLLYKRLREYGIEG